MEYSSSRALIAHFADILSSCATQYQDDAGLVETETETAKACIDLVCCAFSRESFSEDAFSAAATSETCSTLSKRRRIEAEDKTLG